MGEVAAHYAAVRETFEGHLDELGAGGAAFCAYVRGEKVVDLYAGRAAPARSWRQETPSMLFSAAKGIAGLCALVLYDRGELELDAAVARYWPEFAAAGKAGITVRQVLTNSAGLPAIPDYEDLFDLSGPDLGENFAAHEEIHRRMALSEIQYPVGSPAYHVLTFGYLVGALVRRITGRDLATFFEEQVRGPLGLELWFGPAARDVFDRAAQLHPLMPVPRELTELIESLERRGVILPSSSDPESICGRAFLAQRGIGVFDVLDRLGADPQFVSAGVGSGDALGTARGIARMYAVLSQGGELDGVRLVTPRSIDAFAKVRFRDPDPVLGRPAAWTIGFEGNTQLPLLGNIYGPSEAAFGKDGAGGQKGFADPDRRVAVGFVRSHLADFSPLTVRLVEALYRCV
ncbi:serine hydrolase domain-containing protein [Tamaricihabitans halophyticus]|nr:serine hydrolase domain-containing protein [Tamaricihabitans halophyticus]